MGVKEIGCLNRPEMSILLTFAIWGQSHHIIPIISQCQSALSRPTHPFPLPFFVAIVVAFTRRILWIFPGWMEVTQVKH